MAVEHREVAGVFEDADKLQGAIDNLLTSGFDRADLSLLAGSDTVEKKLGPHFHGVADLTDNPRAPRVDYVENETHGAAQGALVGGFGYVGAVAAAGAVVATGGALAAAIAAAAAVGGAGGLVGAALARVIGEKHGSEMQSQLEKGGVILWVHVSDPQREQRALDILKQHSGQNVQIHALPGT